MAINKKFIDPEDGKSFTTRKLAKEHMAKMGHKGAVIVEEVPVAKVVYKGKKPSKRQEKKSQKEEKMTTAWELYTKYVKKGHVDKDVFVLVSLEMEEDEGKIKGWVGTMKGRIRKEGKKKDKKPESVEVIEEEEDVEIRMWCRLADKDWEIIQNKLPVGINYTPNPQNGNHIIQYTNFNEIELDYLMFKYDFVEIEMVNSDLLFILPQIELHSSLFIKDMATLEFMSAGGVKENGCIEVSPEWEVIDNSQLIGRLSFAPPTNLACVGGIWDKMAAAKTTAKKTETVTTTSTISKGDYDYYMYGAEQEFGGYGGNILGGKTYTPSATTYRHGRVLPPVKPKPKIPKYHPVYKISEEYIFIDRMIDYSIYIS